MKNLTINQRAEVKLTAEQWELYTASFDCTKAAEALNDAVQFYFNSGKTRQEVWDAVTRVMHKYEDFGASDTEPREVLRELLNTLYVNE